MHPPTALYAETLPSILEDSLVDWMTQGGDARIVLDPASGLNRYNSAPRPSPVLAFASSTANDLSADALAHLTRRFPQGAEALRDAPAYGRVLEELRGEIRAAYAIDPGVDIAFAPSGTDLEYIALLAVAERRAGGIANLLLGADEVGSGCIDSAAGRFFAYETALGVEVEPGTPIGGLPPVALGDLPVRDEGGAARDSVDIAADMDRAIAAALAQDRFPLVHVVHGSKTGLVLPRLEHIDALHARFGGDVAFVVDACQARITSAAVQAFLARDVIVLLTGSKFMGGPPFSGFALLPPGVAARAAPPASGMAAVLLRAELPMAWTGRDTLRDSGNPGLALRLCAALFELGRFQRIAPARLAAIIAAFDDATAALARRLGVRRIANVADQSARAIDYPVEMLTLATLDLATTADGTWADGTGADGTGADGTGADGTHRGGLDFAAATRIHADLIADGIRLGQPVRCVRLPGGGWGATLRIGLSMPQVVLLDALGNAKARAWLDAAMARIGDALQRRLPRR